MPFRTNESCLALSGQRTEPPLAWVMCSSYPSPVRTFRYVETQ